MPPIGRTTYRYGEIAPEQWETPYLRVDCQPPPARHMTSTEKYGEIALATPLSPYPRREHGWRMPRRFTTAEMSHPLAPELRICAAPTDGGCRGALQLRRSPPFWAEMVHTGGVSALLKCEVRIRARERAPVGHSGGVVGPRTAGSPHLGAWGGWRMPRRFTTAEMSHPLAPELRRYASVQWPTSHQPDLPRRRP